MALIFYFLQLFIITKINAWKYNLSVHSNQFDFFLFNKRFHKNLFNVSDLFMARATEIMNQKQPVIKVVSWDSMAACHMPERDSSSSRQIFSIIKSIKHSLSRQSCVVFVRFVAYFTYRLYCPISGTTKVSLPWAVLVLWCLQCWWRAKECL